MRNGFTLAETLITLGIIGVVAAITLPTVVGHYKEKRTVTQLKKVYSILSQGYLRALADNGSPDTWDIKSSDTLEGAMDVANVLKDYIKMDICDETNKANCWPENFYNLSGYKMTLWSDRVFGRLNDGTLFWLYVKDANCQYNRSDTDKNLQQVCAEFAVNLTGFKKPNVYGKDIFWFFLTKNNVIPAGLEADSRTIEEYCNITANIGNNGVACGAWVLINENMDYLHCSDLSWNGKHKCK